MSEKVNISLESKVKEKFSISLLDLFRTHNGIFLSESKEVKNSLVLSFIDVSILDIPNTGICSHTVNTINKKICESINLDLCAYEKEILDDMLMSKIKFDILRAIKFYNDTNKDGFTDIVDESIRATLGFDCGKRIYWTGAHKKKDGFSDLFSTIEYPDNEEILNGVKDGISFCYVSNSFLDGLINYTDNKMVYVVCRYEEIASLIEEVNKLKLPYQYHQKFSVYPDDVVILSESENSLWYFYYDKDCSDCEVARVSKKDTGLSLEQFAKLFEAETDCLRIEGDFKGWVATNETK